MQTQSVNLKYLNRRHALALALGLASSSPLLAQALDVVDETWHDAGRRRDVPVRLRWPSIAASASPAGLPVVLFSHGLGGTRDAGEVWGEAWAAAGFVVLHLQHAGSDLDAARRVASSFSDSAALRGLGTAQQLIARLQDVVFALDEMARRRQGARAGIDQRWALVRTDAVGLGGHSFGAHTALGVGGQSYPGYPGMNEPRIAALAAFSPTLPVLGNAQQAFAAITRPVLCLTGTLDGDVLGNGASPDRRAGVFAALPAGNKAQLILKDADHMTFGGQTGRAAGILPRAAVTQSLQAGQHALVARITTDWWRSHLLGDAAARARLLNPSGLNSQDIWQTG